VYGFGEQKTAESFRQACRRFIYTENLVAAAPVPEAGQPAKTRRLHPPGAATPLLCQAIAQMDEEDGWVQLGRVGQQLGNLAPDFDPRTYGHAKLSDLVRETGAFDIDRPEGKNLRIRLKGGAAPGVEHKPDAESKPDGESKPDAARKPAGEKKSAGEKKKKG